ncbi:DUF5133 domain-containing protein [Streptomyces sp. NPDC059957]|uniref:DUF5133 domain-containing protein n=1 Tax=Streptomyces sp. NPDC059957 TaxID=3347016 RepID=UPI00365C5629
MAKPVTAWATGMLMAAVPCSAREAAQILQAAAERVNVSAADIAAVLVATAPGEVAPDHIERALHLTVLAVRSLPAGPRETGLLPSLPRTQEVLARLQRCRARLARAPGDPDALRAMDDAAYTLCVLLGQPHLRLAISAAEQHVSRLR